MREMLIEPQETYYMGLINKHIANMEVLLNNPVGIVKMLTKISKLL